MYKKIITVLVFLSSAAFAQAVGPKVTIPQTDYDYTQVPKGETLSHTYMIYNGGGGTLFLSDLKSSCTCIEASLNKTKLEPADSAGLSVVYTNIGNTKTLDNVVSIKTNDPSNPSVRIYITRVNPTNAPTLAQMPSDSVKSKFSIPEIYFPDSTHDFGLMKQGTTGDYVFKFANKGNAVLRIKDIRTSCGCTAALVKSKEIGPGQEGELRVEFDSSGKIGKLSRMITVYTNDPHHVEKTLIIYADVERESK